MEHKNIFISYAKEDISYAENLYDFLISKNYNPWLDKKKLLPGQDWNFMIQDALHKADFIILLLSNVSVNKRGYVQREFRKAVEYCDYKLDSDIFVIPIKINDCTVPINLQKFQWVKYGENVFNQITTAIETQRKTLLNTSSTLEISDQTIQISENIKQGELGDYSPKHIYEFHYPEFDLTDNNSLIDLNTLIQADVLNSMMNVRNNFYEHLLIDGIENALNPDDPEDSTSYGRIEIKLINSNFVSFTSFISEYYTGTAHGMYATTGNNYYMNPIRSFKFFDLFDDKESSIHLLRNIVHEKLMAIAKNGDAYYSIEDDGIDDLVEMSPEDKQSSFYVYDQGLQAEEENFDNYYFKNEAIVFIYNPYDITAWSDGDHFPEISFDELLESFPKQQRLQHFISQLRSE